MIEVKNGSYLLKKKTENFGKKNQILQFFFNDHVFNVVTKGNKNQNRLLESQKERDLINLENSKIGNEIVKLHSSNQYESQKKFLRRQNNEETANINRKKNMSTKNDHFEVDTSFRASEGTSGYIVSVKSNIIDLNIYQNPTSIHNVNMYEKKTDLESINFDTNSQIQLGFYDIQNNFLIPSLTFSNLTSDRLQKTFFNLTKTYRQLPANRF
nr:hypothetical protein [Trentepohlia sp. YN1242]